MRSVVIVVVVILSIGCGNGDVDKGEAIEDQAGLKRAMSDYADTIAVANSKSPAVRLLGWQREWSKDTTYSQPMAGVFVTQRNEYTYNWKFSDRDVVLTVSERSDVSDESRQFLYMFVMELEGEWRIGPRFMYEDDTKAGAVACSMLQQMIIDEAIRLEETTRGPVYPDAYPESKAERIEMMRGPNHALARSMSYKTLLKSGKELSSDKVKGDVFS